MTRTPTTARAMTTLWQFLDGTRARTTGGPPFTNESERTLAIDVDGGVWLKPGAAIAYTGAVSFERRATLDGDSARDALLRETAPLVRAAGRGRVFCGHHGCHVHVVTLADQSLVVAWPDLLAFESRLSFETTLVGGALGLAAGGLVAVRLRGSGALALATHGRPLTLPVRPDQPVHTDPHATLAWSEDLEPRLETDLTWRAFIGHGGQEPIQMRFEGAGYVVVQPYEEAARMRGALRSLKQLAALVSA